MNIIDAYRDGVAEAVPAAAGEDVPGGAYECRVTAARVVASRRGDAMLEVVWDIASGPYAGHFSDPFYAGKDFRHMDRAMLEGDARVMGFTKHKIAQLARCGGMDETEAGRVVARAFGSFDKVRRAPGARVEVPELVGKAVWLLLREHLYDYDGKGRSEVEVVEWLTAEEARTMTRADGSQVKVPEPRDERGKAAPAAAPGGARPNGAPGQGATYDDEIPF